MNYYIKGNAAKADQIKAAFEKLGYDISWPGGCANPDIINIGVERNGAKYVVAETSEYIKDIIKTHPDYKELELHIEPKFKVGDWVVRNNGSSDVPIQIYKLKKDRYLVTNTLGSKGEVMLTRQDKWHLWTISDAKDGDMLVTTKIRNCPFIYRKTDYNNDLAYYYAGIDGNGNFCEGCRKRTIYHFGPVEDVAPATKEQVTLLFAKMKEAGYQWDADKKELRKIQPHYDISNFKPFDKVLVRDSKVERWYNTHYGFYDKSVHQFVCDGDSEWNQCIPFDGNEHLLGTTDMCDEQYINW